MRKIVVFGLSLATGLIGTTTLAQEPSRFGQAGQVALGSDLSLRFDRSSTSFEGESQTTSTSVEAQPAADFFVIDNLSIGGALGFRWEEGGGDYPPRMTTVGIVPRVGYNIPAGDKLSIWPRLGLSYGFVSLSPGRGRPAVSGNAVALRVEVPFALHLASHFFIGIGPYYATDLVAKTEGEDAPKASHYGIGTGLFGWF